MANGDLPIFVMAITIAMLIVVSLIVMMILMIRMMMMMNMKNAMEKNIVSVTVRISYICCFQYFYNDFTLNVDQHDVCACFSTVMNFKHCGQCLWASSYNEII